VREEQFTDFHAAYYAHVLSQQHGGDGVARLTRTLFEASVDLNPHQIDAALFALRSPISKGVILADEVGLGKTIEAGLLVCQHWAERRRRMIIVAPASLRTQWQAELEEKFNLPSIVIDAKIARDLNKQGQVNPFDHRDQIVITSYHYANKMRGLLRAIGWDLVVIDEAHKLRNVYQPSNRIGSGLKWAFEDRKKVLLTATPLQNKLDELYGLASLIDDRIFGDIRSFRTQYTTAKADLEDLRQRLASFCHRTLRRQVLEYIRYTERRAITVPFTPTDDEQTLYGKISEFLARDVSYAIPSSQKHLTTLILHKLLASSSHAIIGTLETMIKRLERLRDQKPEETKETDWRDDLDALGEYLDEEVDAPDDAENDSSTVFPVDTQRLEAEIGDLAEYLRLARTISTDTKAKSLLTALETGFAEMAEVGAKKKALIFTESRRTQDFLRRYLEGNGFAGKVVLFSGTNSDDIAQQVYKNWLAANAGSGRITGSRAIDMRTALVAYFRDEAEIMITTEAGAEGINLQFCSLIINYDLPWNPQRVEQRIGRCHRYGQQNDVVVINFLNQRNEADRRVHQLLTEKFALFEGVFGASDEVLGSLESGIDFEKRILQIYQSCRNSTEIDTAFDQLQGEMDQAITAKLTATRTKLLEHFDEDVHKRLKGRLDDTQHAIDQYSQMFWSLTKHELASHAAFDDANLAFHLSSCPPMVSAPLGGYHLISKGKDGDDGFVYRPSHPLGEHVLQQALQKSFPTFPTLTFDITGHPTRIAVVEMLKGQSGLLRLQKLVVCSLHDQEILLFSAVNDTGEAINPEACEKLFSCRAEVLTCDEPPSPSLLASLECCSQEAISMALRDGNRKNAKVFEEERERLDKWIHDVEVTSEKELQDTKGRIRDLQRQAAKATDAVERLSIQKKIQHLERLKRKLRQEIFDVQDQAEAKRDGLIQGLHRQMEQKTSVQTIFEIRWAVI
jgi:hypothetical protein